MSLNRAVPLTCSGHTRPVVHLSFSRLDKDGTYLLVSSCKDGNPMLREWTGDWIGTFIGHKGAVWCTKLSVDSSKAATGSADFTAKIWDTFSGAVLQSFPHNHIVRSVAFSPSTSHFMTGGQEKKVRIFDLRRSEAEPDFLGADTAHDGTIKSVVWIDDWNTVTAAEDGNVKWWDIRTRFPTSTLTFPAPITSMELSTRTSTLVLTSGQTVAFLPSLPSSKPSHNVTLSYAPSSASLHPILADRFVAGSTADQWVRIHGMNGEEREVHKGHHGPVHCVEYSPDGEMYASGSEDGKGVIFSFDIDFHINANLKKGTIRLWQTTPGKSYGLWQGTNGL